MAKEKKPAKRKAVNVKFEPRKRTNGKVAEVYKLMEQQIKDHHSHLKDARIVIAWGFGWKMDPDGNLELGKSGKPTELARQIGQYDLEITLNHEWWNLADTSVADRLAELDVRLCHFQVDVDRSGEPKQDDDGKILYRKRKVDFHGFQDVVGRHGLYTDRIREAMKAAQQRQDTPLFDEDEPATIPIETTESGAQPRAAAN